MEMINTSHLHGFSPMQISNPTTNKRSAFYSPVQVCNSTVIYLHIYR